MELMTARWTDDRMDDLKHQVDELGRRMDGGFAELRDELRAHRRDVESGFDKIERYFEKVDRRFEKVDRRFERMDSKLDAKFDAVHDQIARTQETIIGLYAMLSRFSLWLAGAVVVAVVAALMALWLR